MSKEVRKLKRKKVEEVVFQIEAPASQVPPQEIEFLSAEDLKNLEIYGRDVENAKLYMSNEEQCLVNLELQLQILKINIEKQRAAVSTKAQRYEVIKTKFIEFKRRIWPNYGLREDDPIGYDPISGRIKRT